MPFPLAVTYEYAGPAISFVLGTALFGIDAIGAELEDPLGDEINDLPYEVFEGTRSVHFPSLSPCFVLLCALCLFCPELEALLPSCVSLSAPFLCQHVLLPAVRLTSLLCARCSQASR